MVEQPVSGCVLAGDEMEPIQIIRVAEGKNSTLSHLYIDNLFACYLLEDTIRSEKVPGVTCIPEGEFGLSLNSWAGMNTRYAKRYPEFHEGMIEITEIPNYQLVFFHTGNYHTHTAGCPLVGLYWQMEDGDYQVKYSQAAYRRVYPQILGQVRHGKDRIAVENRV